MQLGGLSSFMTWRRHARSTLLGGLLRLTNLQVVPSNHVVGKPRNMCWPVIIHEAQASLAVGCAEYTEHMRCASMQGKSNTKNSGRHALRGLGVQPGSMASRQGGALRCAGHHPNPVARRA